MGLHTAVLHRDVAHVHRGVKQRVGKGRELEHSTVAAERLTGKHSSYLSSYSFKHIWYRPLHVSEPDAMQ